MILNQTLWLGSSPEGAVTLLPQMANRHGLIAGATGTGKTVSLQVLAEGFSKLGVPVFLADVKGDLAGLCKPGQLNEKIESRLRKCGAAQAGFTPQANPVVFWDVYGEKGHPVRCTVSEMGPLLLSRLLQLNATQSGILYLVFKIADDEGLLLIDLKDLRAVLSYVGENAAKYTLEYGNITKPSIGAIQRAIAVLEDQGGNAFFGEPALDLSDWFAQDEEGHGTINILAAEKLYRNPTMYSTFLLWMLSELYDILPEVGDAALPRMVFFFDEAHLLFSDCSKALLERVEQTVKLIRSKGVGVFFVTQNPTDVPSGVLSQLSARVQHALRAFTPQEIKTVKSVAQTFRPNPSFNTEEALTRLGTGEALLSFLQADGTPSPVQQCVILPPQSTIGTISDDLRATFIETDAVADRYDAPFDRMSAYEYLAGQLAAQAPVQSVVQPLPGTVQEAVPAAPASVIFKVFDPASGTYVEREMMMPAQAMPVPVQNIPAVPQQMPAVTPAAAPIPVEAKSVRTAKSTKKEKSFGGQLLESFARSATTSAARTVGNQLTRSLLGTLGLTGTKRKR